MTDKSTKTLVLFDFDKTLVRTDSFRLFVSICATSVRDQLRAIAAAVLCKAGILSNRRYKEYLLKHLWGSRSLETRGVMLDRFLKRIQKQQNPVVVAHLLDHVRAGHSVAVLSASPEFYLQPLVHLLAEGIEVYGSQVMIDGSCVEVDNLFAERKAERARLLIEERKPDHVCVYTDHVSDRLLMRLADHVTLVRPKRRLLREARRLGVEFQTIE